VRFLQPNPRQQDYQACGVFGSLKIQSRFLKKQKFRWCGQRDSNPHSITTEGF
jgi:hypothetical protein